MLRYSLYSDEQVREPDQFESYSSDNSSAAENQQERLIKMIRILRDYMPDADDRR